MTDILSRAKENRNIIDRRLESKCHEINYEFLILK